MSTKRATTPGFRDPRYKKLIERLVERRKEIGMTQQQLAERIGLHKQFVSRYELGERRLDVVEFSDISQALDLAVATLLNEMDGDGA